MDFAPSHEVGHTVRLTILSSLTNQHFTVDYSPSLPYLVRLRQCLIEYLSSSRHNRRPLFNALKYASSFPVIFLSAAQRIVVSDLVAEKGQKIADEAWHGEHALFRLW